jgi:hypothetical protein
MWTAAAVLLGGASAGLLAATSTKGAAALMLGVLVLAPMALAKTSTNTVYAIAIAVGLEILVPITRIQQYGALKYAIPAISALALVWALARRGTKRIRWSVVLLAVLLLLAVPTTLIGGDRLSHNYLVSMIVVALPVAMLASDLDPAERGNVQKLILWMALGEAVLAIAERLTKMAPLWRAAGDSPNGIFNAAPNVLLNDSSFRAQGTLSHPLPLGLVLCVGLAVLSTKPVFRSNLVTLASTALLVLGMIYAGDRSAILISCLLAIFAAGHAYARAWPRILKGVLPLVGALWATAHFGGFSTPVVTRLTGSFSATHRASSLIGFSELLHQPMLRVLFGNGLFSAPYLYESGVLARDGVTNAIDNQVLTTFADQGLIGLALMAALVITSLKMADRVTRTTLLVLVAMFFVYDLVLWPSSFVLLVLVLAMGSNKSDGEAPEEEISSTYRTANPSVAAA